ncbi:uncharacterized protein KY384_001011 [Bacidia gigantensis]|uniref:uncharacterized protein n=1 Tax=Bacidia gigantensis TaxID=2732470 RepID=UPI001D052EDF|nr:uncharacterized protein KY384_001011 [Bacidia gigantensis]KAG8534167.1 hypothetical protein KY384_001011 [Bacidia gigantensis]
MDFPRTHIKCDCTDLIVPSDDSQRPEDECETEDVKTFDPRTPRANFSLYPLEHLLYCEDCSDIKCPKCVIEEIICWYCPGCLFEVPISTVKSEGGSQLQVSSINQESALRGVQGPWILGCPYCHWGSLDIGWQFEKNANLHHQIAKLRLEDDQQDKSSSKEYFSSSTPSTNEADAESRSTFANLRSFYRSQLSVSGNADPLLTPSGGYNYNSPSSIARIVNIYTGKGTYGKKDPSKGGQMREALDNSEGLRVLDHENDQDIINRLRAGGWKGSTGLSQRTDQQHSPQVVVGLRPQQPFLRTKRSKRCRTCRHILVKPEPKISSTRFKIKLVALNYIPTISLKPLLPAAAIEQTHIDLRLLPPLRAIQCLLTLKNPLFESVRITLATPAVTPGRHQHKVTILCPDFEIGSNVDQWDEALNTSSERRRSKHPNLSKPEYSGGSGGKIAEAGKVWDKGRSWTTVVLEVVCADVHGNGRRDEDLEEDEDLLEIPIYVRMEWEGEAQGDGAAGTKGEVRKEKKELAYWVALGVGKIARLRSGEIDTQAKTP